MKEGFTVLIFHSFLLATGFGLSYKMLDKDNQRIEDETTIHGRYTRGIRNAELLIPWHGQEDGSFVTFTLPKFYDRQELEDRKKRAVDSNANTDAADADADTATEDLADQKLHLILPFNGDNHHVELTPHHEFISPDLVVETHGENAYDDLENGIRFKRIPDLQCHYRGRIRGHKNSRAALSLCDGVAGFVQTDHGRFYIEPVSESEPNQEGQHVHMVYKRKAPDDGTDEHKRVSRSCGVSDDWESAWAEELEIKNRRERSAGNSSFIKRAPVSSASHSIHRFLELTVVCDKSFLEAHKGSDYEQYVLTNLNIAADFYHDASVGNQIDLTVVRIIYLEKEKQEIDLAISTNAPKTLTSFSKWCNKMNPKDSKHPNHHDICVLITKYDICSEDKQDTACNVVGLASVAAACNPERAACINEDTGLTLGDTIAHELGHVLGCGHDVFEQSGCNGTAPDNTTYIMSPIAGIETRRWSPCSRKFITTFLSGGLGECLINNPKKPNEKYKFPGMLPGAMFDALAQCNFVFPGSTTCGTLEDICEHLWCSDKPGKCRSRSSAADGTKCGEKKWCQGRKCVEIGKRPAATNGEWSSWGKPGTCSRTCGGGVSATERECDNPAPKDGGRYCLGERVRYTICNTSPCDEKKPGYRAVQCSEFDSQKVLSDGLHKWTPHQGDPDAPCALFCVNEKNTYVKLAPVAKDGTPCQAGTRNMCIGGVCRKVGCDWVLDSGAEDDQCGICKGDGTQCTAVEGDYTATGQGGYQKIVTVPKGSQNIKVYEKSKSQNVLAIKFEKGNTYILNGGNTENRNGEYPCAGDIAIYRHPEPQKEEILIRGPITSDIQLQYAFYKPRENPGVHWVYYVQGQSKSGRSSPKYQWDFLEWGSCSAKCGGGTQVSQASCIEQASGKVSNSFCKDIKTPDPKSRICNNKPCGAKWRVSQWSRCSGCGGKQGEQRRKVQCMKPSAHAGGEDVQAELSACKGTAPKQTQTCTGTKPCKNSKKKKARSNVIETKRPSQEEQRNIIDKLVDVGIKKYSAKSYDEHADQVKSQKRNVEADFKHLIDNWAGPSDAANIVSRGTCQDEDNPQGAQSVGYPTLKPGSVIKDDIKPDDIVVLEAPVIDETLKSNLSDQAFQEDGDSVGAEIDTSKMKIYKGAEAAELLKDHSVTPSTNISITR